MYLQRFTRSAFAAAAVLSFNSALAFDIADDSGVNTIRILGDAETVRQSAGSAHIVSETDLETFEYTDINRALRQVPGVYLQEEDGFGLRPNIGIRGSGTERSGHITLMEDGVLIAPAPYAASSAYYFPTFGRINAIEVLKGPAAIQYGPFTVGGAINLVSTPIPEMAAGRVDVEVGSFSEQRLHAHYGSSTENFGWLLETHQQESDGFKDIDFSSDETGLDKEDWMFKFRINSDASAAIYQQLDVKLQYSREISDQSYLGLTDGDFNDDPYRMYLASELDEMDNEHDQVVLSYYADITPALDFRATAYHNNFKRNWFKTEGLDLDGSASADDFSRTSWFDVVQEVNQGGALAPTYQAILDGGDTLPGAIELRANNREYFSRGLQLQLDYKFNTGPAAHNLKVGARIHEDEEDRLQRKSTYHQENGTLVLDDYGMQGNAGNRVQSAEAKSLFVYDTIRFGDLLLTPGIRYETMDLERDNYGNQPLRDPANLSERSNDASIWLPGIGANWALTPKLTLLGGVHKGFSPPGNSPDTDPEESWNYEAGLRYGNNGLYLESIVFYNDYENILGECTNQSGGSCDIEDQGNKFNGNGATVKGLEFLASLDLSHSDAYSMPARFAYTYTDAEFASTFDSDFFGSVSNGDPVPYIPEQLWQASIGFEKAAWSLFANLSFVDEMCTQASCGSFEETEDHLVLDLAGQYRLSNRVTTYFGVDNVTEEEDIIARQPYGARPDKARAFKLGLRVDF